MAQARRRNARSAESKPRPDGQTTAAAEPTTDLLDVARAELASGRAQMRRVKLPRDVEPVTVFRAEP